MMQKQNQTTASILLQKAIRKAIQFADNRLSFCDFMQLALYHKEYGYYMSSIPKIGISGDFITAPEVSPLYSQCLAKQCKEILASLGHGDILEIGAGRGTMAVTILDFLADFEYLDHYYIYEKSEALKQLQQKLIQEKFPSYTKKVVWLNDLNSISINGIIIANEIIDVLPVHIFSLTKKGVKEKVVTWKDEHLQWEYQTSENEKFNQQVNKIIKDYHLASLYESEINLSAFSWLASIKKCLESGVVLLIDYGFSGQEYYHVDRHMGTLMCHYQHQAHTDPLIHLGLQDITAHVDFTSVAENAYNVGFEIAGYLDQAHFLINCGITELLANALECHANHHESQLLLSQQVKKLTMPHEMGELFKVMALTVNFSTILMGFKHFNKLERL